VTAVENLLSQQAKEALHGGVVAGGPDSARGANSRGGSRRGRIFSCNTAIVAPPIPRAISHNYAAKLGGSGSRWDASDRAC
jgi:hypothetical protein